MQDEEPAPEADANKSWEGMRQILDREMPEDKDKKRTGFFLLFGVLVIGGLLTWGGMKVFRNEGNGHDRHLADGRGAATTQSGTGRAQTNGNTPAGQSGAASSNTPVISATSGNEMNGDAASRARNGSGSLTGTEGNHQAAGTQASGPDNVQIATNRSASNGTDNGVSAPNTVPAAGNTATSANKPPVNAPADGNQAMASNRNTGNSSGNTVNTNVTAANAGVPAKASTAARTSNNNSTDMNRAAGNQAQAGDGQLVNNPAAASTAATNTNTNNKNNTSASTSTRGNAVTLPTALIERLNGQSYRIINDTIICCSGNTKLVIVNLPDYLKGPAVASAATGTANKTSGSSSVGLNQMPKEGAMTLSANKGAGQTPESKAQSNVALKLQDDPNASRRNKGSKGGSYGSVGQTDPETGRIKQELFFKLPFQIGASGGVYTSIIPAQPNWGWMGGLNVVVPFDDRWSMMLDVRYMQHYTNKFTIADYALQKVRVEEFMVNNQPVYRTTYDSLSLLNHVKSYGSLQVPLAIQHMMGKMLLYAGVNLNWVINSRLENEMQSFRLYRTDTLGAGQTFTEMSNTDASFKASSLSHRLGMGYTFGMSYYVAPGVYMDVRLTQGLTDKKDQFSGQTAPYFKAPFLQFSVGYRLGSPIRDMRK